MIYNFQHVFCREISSVFLFGGKTDVPFLLFRNALQERNDVQLSAWPGHPSTLQRHALLVSRNVIISDFTIGHL